MYCHSYLRFKLRIFKILLMKLRTNSERFIFLNFSINKLIKKLRILTYIAIVFESLIATIVQSLKNIHNTYFTK